MIIQTMKHMYKAIIWIVALTAISFYGCRSREAYSFVSLYFIGMDQLEDGLVYTYKVTTDTSTTMFHQFHKSVPDSIGYIYTVQSYTDTWEVSRLETYSWEDSLLKLTQWIDYDNERGKVTHTRRAKIHQDQYLSWKDADTLRSHTMEILLPDNLDTNIEITRKYMGRDNLDWQGQVLSSVIFEVIFERSYQNNSDSAEVIMFEESYAKGIGLVSKKSKTPNAYYLSQLIRIQSMDQFLKSKQIQ
jgi:hypothetical protein